MSDIYRCENCLYSAPNPINDKSQSEFGNLECRRYPPQPIFMEDQKVHAYRIPTNHNWWCGEWKAKVRLVKLEPIKLEKKEAIRVGVWETITNFVWGKHQ